MLFQDSEVKAKSSTRIWRPRRAMGYRRTPNGYGSVDVWFGPKAPEGKESNWVPSEPNRRFELMFRLYGPAKALFDKAWTLADVEKVAAR